MQSSAGAHKAGAAPAEAPLQLWPTSAKQPLVKAGEAKKR